MDIHLLINNTLKLCSKTLHDDTWHLTSMGGKTLILASWFMKCGISGMGMRCHWLLLIRGRGKRRWKITSECFRRKEFETAFENLVVLLKNTDGNPVSIGWWWHFKLFKFWATLSTNSYLWWKMLYQCGYSCLQPAVLLLPAILLALVDMASGPALAWVFVWHILSLTGADAVLAVNNH